MKTELKKQPYIAPEIEIIELESEGVIAASVGDIGDGGDMW